MEAVGEGSLSWVANHPVAEVAAEGSLLACHPVEAMHCICSFEAPPILAGDFDFDQEPRHENWISVTAWGALTTGSIILASPCRWTVAKGRGDQSQPEEYPLQDCWRK